MFPTPLLVKLSVFRPFVAGANEPVASDPGKRRWSGGGPLARPFDSRFTMARNGWLGKSTAYPSVINREPFIAIFPVKTHRGGEIEIRTITAGITEMDEFFSEFFFDRRLQVGRFGGDLEDLVVRPLI
jgi:hypothetical protein